MEELAYYCWRYYQFPPGLSRAALYQAVVALGMGLSFQNEACRTGAEHLLNLDWSAKDKHVSPEAMVESNRNPHIDYPI